MDADEKAISDYLKSWPGQFVAAREISRRAGGKWRFRDDPEWAGPVLARMVERALVESDSTGHYRLIRERKNEKAKKQWVSPEIRKILENSGKDFGELTEPEEGDDFYTNK